MVTQPCGLRSTPRVLLISVKLNSFPETANQLRRDHSDSGAGAQMDPMEASLYSGSGAMQTSPGVLNHKPLPKTLKRDWAEVLNRLLPLPTTTLCTPQQLHIPTSESAKRYWAITQATVCPEVESA